MRSLLTTVLLLSCLVLATGRVEGRDASPDPVDLTQLSLDQLLGIQVAAPEMQARPGEILGDGDVTAQPAPLRAPASDFVGPPAMGWAAPQRR